MARLSSAFLKNNSKRITFANLNRNMNIEAYIKDQVSSILKEKFEFEVPSDKVLLNMTKAEVEGDYTVVLFPYLKPTGKNPMELGTALGNQLLSNSPLISKYEILKGFLNLYLSNEFYTSALEAIAANPNYGQSEKNGETVVVEFSSPNTNKPLHLGHIRNILLGWSTAQLLEKAGYDVIKTQIVNDRGIAVCKSMLAWLKEGGGKTPKDANIKGDHFVGQYYVLFNKLLKDEYTVWQNTDLAKQKEAESNDPDFFNTFKNDYFNEYSALGKEAKEMLLKWENNDPETRALWQKMNSWVYEGFEQTYQALGVSFDSIYYESDTYLLGKEHIEKGLEQNVFYRKADNSVWIDLEDAKLDHKIVLRSDGTALYMTQDIGTVDKRYQDTGASKMVYVVGDEQDYHFKVLFEIVKRLGAKYADGLYHLSYGMVDLPTGKMKSREGTVVDADDLISEIILEAKESAESSEEISSLSQEGRSEIFRRIGLAALKFFILKVGARKRMVFDPKESLDMQGQTGPYIQNAYVRVMSVLRKDVESNFEGDPYTDLKDEEKALIMELTQFPQLIKSAAEKYEPSDMANYCYGLAKLYHKFYHECRILSAPDQATKYFRLKLSKQVASVLSKGMNLLGIEMPERM